MGRLRWRWLLFGELTHSLTSSTGWRKTRLVIATSLVAISIHALGVQIHEIAAGDRHWPAWRLLLFFVVSFIVVLRWLQIELHGLLAANLHVNPNPRQACKALILFLSPPVGKEKCWQTDFEGRDAQALVE